MANVLHQYHLNEGIHQTIVKLFNTTKIIKQKYSEKSTTQRQIYHALNFVKDFLDYNAQTIERVYTTSSSIIAL